MSKSDLAKVLDKIEAEIYGLLKEKGFKKNGRTFNRKTDDGLIQVLHIQMGSFDPPGTTYVPGLTQNLYGKFTINCGIFVPEVADQLSSKSERGFVQEHSCCLRARLGRLSTGHADIWWEISDTPMVSADVINRIKSDAFTFFSLFESRDLILQELDGLSNNFSSGSPPRIISAIILLGRGEKERAKELLTLQALETRNPGHPIYVRKLAERLGIPLPE